VENKEYGGNRNKRAVYGIKVKGLSFDMKAKAG
jgi:hypothetical protein